MNHSMITTIKASYGGGTFEAQINPADVPAMLGTIDDMADKNGLNRSSARQFVVDSIQANDHLKAQTGSLVAQTLLWLACRSPEPLGQMAETIALEGGKSIEYQITGDTPGVDVNFRLIIHNGEREVRH